MASAGASTQHRRYLLGLPTKQCAILAHAKLPVAQNVAVTSFKAIVLDLYVFKTDQILT